MGSVSAKGSGRRRVSLLIGLLFVLLGVLLLLTTTGVVSFGIWLELADYWPLLLVLIGVEFILIRRALLIRAGVIVLILVVSTVAAYFSVPEYAPNDPLRVTYAEPLRDAETLHLNMEFVGGSVELTSEMPDAPSPARLLAADFKSRPARVMREPSDGSITYYVMSSGPFLRHTSDDGYSKRRVSFPVGLADWRLTVSPEVEVEIDILSVATDLDLDLRNINVRKLSVETGTSDIRIQLPDNAGQTHIDIAAGATEVEIVVPQGVAARIDIDAPIKSARINPVRFLEADNEYWSPDYLEARNRVSIDIEALSADVTVR